MRYAFYVTTVALSLLALVAAWHFRPAKHSYTPHAPTVAFTTTPTSTVTQSSPTAIVAPTDWTPYHDPLGRVSVLYPRDYTLSRDPESEDDLIFDDRARNMLFRVSPRSDLGALTWGTVSERFSFDPTLGAWRNTLSGDRSPLLPRRMTGESQPIYEYSTSDPGTDVHEALIANLTTDMALVFSLFLYYDYGDNDMATGAPTASVAARNMTGLSMFEAMTASAIIR